MGQLKLMPSTNVLSLKVARVLKRVNSDGGVKANNYLSGATEPPLPLTSHRLELIKSLLNGPSGSAEEQATRISQHPAPRANAAPADGHHGFTAAPLIRPLLTLSAGIRILAAALVLVALLPNLILAAIFWLGIVDTPRSSSVAPPPIANPSALALSSPVPQAQSDTSSPVLSMPEILEVTAGEEVIFPIALDGTDTVPAGSVIAISGLPPGSTLSSGRRHRETEWHLAPEDIGDLHLILPNTADSEAKLVLQLIGPHGAIIANTTTILKVTADPQANIPVHRVTTQPIQGQVWDEPSQRLGTRNLEERPVNLDAANSGDAVPLPTRRPAPTESTTNGNVDSYWITSSAHVNLRKGPTASAAVLGVVVKGAKLRVLGRKRGWVEVINPANSQKGWIYAGNVEIVR